MRRLVDTIALVAIAACLGFAGAWYLRGPPAGPADVVGVPRILDGDTVEIAGERIRLLGIDAPETDQVCLDARAADWTCGLAARTALVDVAGGKTWRCAVRATRDRYDRLLGTCFAGDVDLDRWMVRHGWALSYRHYTPHPYDADEDAARRDGAGLWTGAFHAPWNWRHRSCTAAILGAAAVPLDARTKLCRG